MPLANARISAQAYGTLLNILLGKCKIINLPEDTELRRLMYDIETDSLVLQLASASFEGRPSESAPIPVISLMCQNTRDSQ